MAFEKCLLFGGAECHHEWIPAARQFENEEIYLLPLTLQDYFGLCPVALGMAAQFIFQGDENFLFIQSQLDLQIPDVMPNSRIISLKPVFLA